MILEEMLNIFFRIQVNHEKVYLSSFSEYEEDISIMWEDKRKQKHTLVSNFDEDIVFYKTVSSEGIVEYEDFFKLEVFKKMLKGKQ